MEVGRAGQGGPINIDYKALNTAAGTKEVADVIEIKDMQVTGNLEQESQQEPKEEEILKAVDKLNKFLEDENVSVEYAVHDKFKDIMIKIVNKETQEVLLEIPPKKILDMIAKMMDTLGVFVDKQV